MTNVVENRRRLLDPCHSKVLSVTCLQLSRMKLKMKLELRALKKITEEVLHDGENSVVVLPANVYENPLETVPNQLYPGIPGYYGSATEDQLKSFFGDTIPATTNVITKDNSVNVEAKSGATKGSTLEATVTSSSVEAYNDNLAPCPDEDMELQNAIWHISPEFNEDNRAVEQMNYNDYLMDHSGEDNPGVLFDLS